MDEQPKQTGDEPTPGETTQTQYACEKCGADVGAIVNTCPHCGNIFEKADNDPENDLAGIEGWLILVVADLIITLFLYVIAFEKFSFSELWDTPDVMDVGGIGIIYKIYAIVIVVAGLFLFNAFRIILLVHIFKKSAVVPRMMIWYYLSFSIYSLLTAVLSGVLMPAGGSFAPEFLQLVYVFAWSAVGISYFHESKRVKATFVQ